LSLSQIKNIEVEKLGRGGEGDFVFPLKDAAQKMCISNIFWARLL